MVTFLADESTGAGYIASELARQHDLVAFVEEWNEGEDFQSLISNMETFMEALYFDKAIWAGYVEARLRAAELGAALEFEAHLSALVLPAIQRTFAIAISKIGHRWADRINRAQASRGVMERAHSSPEGFITRWIKNEEWPVFATPEGGDALNAAEVEAVLRGALLTRLAGLGPSLRSRNHKRAVSASRAKPT